jgi:hypothetical protein
MRAFVRCGDAELALHGPLATCIGVIAQHLAGRARETLDRIARIDRERAPGTHTFERDDFMNLVGAAHMLLCDPPQAVRRVRRVAEGPLPAAERIGALLAWLRERTDDVVIYDLWRSTSLGD